MNQIGTQLKIKDIYNLEPYWDFTVKWGTHKERHGIEIIIWANHYKKDTWDSHFGGCKDRLVFQIHGRYDAGLPAGFGFIADQFLPINEPATLEYVGKPGNPNQVSAVFKVNLGYQCLHATLKKALNDLVSNKDPILAFEVRRAKWRDQKDLGLVASAILPFKASEMIAVLGQNDSKKKGEKLVSAYYSGPDCENLKPASRILRKIRWFSLPLTFMFLCWYLVYNPQGVLAKVTPLWSIEGQKTIKSFLIPTPETKVQAFELGKIFQKWQDITGDTQRHSILQEASTLLNLGKRVLSGEEFEKVLGEMSRLEAYQSYMARVLGFFNFVNIMWFLAIIGIAISAGPTMWQLTAPIRKWLETI